MSSKSNYIDDLKVKTIKINFCAFSTIWIAPIKNAENIEPTICFLHLQGGQRQPYVITSSCFCAVLIVPSFPFHLYQFFLSAGWRWSPVTITQMWIARSLWLRTTTKILTSTCPSRSWLRARWSTKCKKRRLLPASWGNISKGKDRVWNKQQHPTKVLHANLRTFEPESWPIMLQRCNRGLGRSRTLRESLCRRGRRWSWRSGRGLLEWLTGRSIVLSWSFSKHDQISLHLYQVHVCLLHHLLPNDDPHMSLPISPLPICRLLHLIIFNKLKFVLTCVQTLAIFFVS